MRSGASSPPASPALPRHSACLLSCRLRCGPAGRDGARPRHRQQRRRPRRLRDEMQRHAAGPHSHKAQFRCPERLRHGRQRQTVPPRGFKADFGCPERIRSGFSTSQISAPYRWTASRQRQAYAGASAQSALPDSGTAPRRRIQGFRQVLQRPAVLLDSPATQALRP